ncbi:cytochrome b [Pelagibius sp. Alg239-R121]|uniref:cytochrome b n=1 Tax=Pelagibius sp. Alg239-R121 TaxID=2993448 RepID=UPI0024A6396F|nr:cytochrome b [Pelagibius sp. Alg239-R121]
MLSNTANGYGLVSKLLHWLIACCIIGLIGLGWWMVGLSYYDTWYHRGLELHRAIGIVVLLMATVFVVWKILSPSPGLQNELKPWEKLGARVAHILLLAAMFVIPLSGYVISTSSESGFTFFDLFEIPAILPKSESSRDLAIAVHYYIAYGLVAVVAVHAGAAIKHQLIDKHGTLRRMLF